MLEYRHAAVRLMRHWLLCEGRHSIHSPFLFRFFEEVLTPDRRIRLPEVERLRMKLSGDRRLLPGQDAGSGSFRRSARTLRSVVKREAAPLALAACYRRLVRFSGAQEILEIGTSVGLTSMYLAAEDHVRVTTLEANEVLAKVAMENFLTAGRTNIRTVIGNADQTLPELLKKGPPPDLAIIDANHRYEPTLRYARQLSDNMEDSGVIVIDDIHYSREMTNAWKVMASGPAISLALDCGRFGVLFLDPALPREIRTLEVPFEHFNL